MRLSWQRRGHPRRRGGPGGMIVCVPALGTHLLSEGVPNQMLIKKMRAKIHRATITEACVEYVGSITIDEDLLDDTDLQEGECVLVADLTDGQRFETYVIAGERGSGVMCINGAAARLVDVGDKIIVMA